MKIVVAIPHQLTWFWTQTCIAALKRHTSLPIEIVVVDNGWDHSPSIRGITQTRLGEGVRVLNADSLAVYTHSTALNQAFRETWPMDYFVSLDSDCVITKDGWLEDALTRLRPTDFATGAWHPEGGVTCSFALYRGEAIKAMADASAADPDRQLHWGENFEKTALVSDTHRGFSQAAVDELLSGPFSNVRGFLPGTVMKETPTGQRKGPGWYEPAQMFHYWAVQNGWTYTACPARIIYDAPKGIPTGMFYGVDQDSGLDYDQARVACWAVHFFGGTRAWDFLNPRGGNLDDSAIVNNMAFWIEREAGWWLHVVPEDVRTVTLDLIRKYGFATGTPRPDAPPDAIERIKSWCRAGGVAL